MTSTAYYTLGEMYYYGEGGAKQSYIEAFSHYLKSAKKSNRLAQIQIGKMYEFGEGVDKDVDLSNKWYLRAEKGGDCTVQYYLGSLWEHHDINKSISWYKKSSDQGYLKAINRLKEVQDYSKIENEVIELYEQGKYEQAYRILNNYVQNNEILTSRIYHVMGRFYHFGEGGVTKNIYEALQWYHKAEKRGFTAACFSIGSLYEHDKDLENSIHTAIHWYRKGALFGDELAKKALRRLGYSE